jgi:two-component system LytT family response regulator
MLPLRILIADDEPEARELLLYFLKKETTAEIKETADGKSALQMIRSFNPQILFLDIRMPELSGMEVMHQKPASLLPAVIITTAFDEYALPAFDYEVIDYLLKPFEEQRFKKALKRAMEYVEFVHARKPRPYLKHLPVKTGSKTELIPVDDILFFQAEGAYVEVVTAYKTFLVADPLYELQSSLDPGKFERVHRSVIVQVHAVKSIRSLLNGDHLLLLTNGQEIRSSRTYREVIKGMQLKQ